MKLLVVLDLVNPIIHSILTAVDHLLLLRLLSNEPFGLIGEHLVGRRRVPLGLEENARLHFIFIYCKKS